MKPAAEPARMTYGWRRFFTRAYWRFQWLGWRMFGHPVDVRGVGTLTIDDPNLTCLPMDWRRVAARDEEERAMGAQPEPEREWRTVLDLEGNPIAYQCPHCGGAHITPHCLEHSRLDVLGRLDVLEQQVAALTEHVRNLTEVVQTLTKREQE